MARRSGPEFETPKVFDPQSKGSSNTDDKLDTHRGMKRGGVRPFGGGMK